MSWHDEGRESDKLIDVIQEHDEKAEDPMDDPLVRADVYIAEAEAKIYAAVEAMTQAVEDGRTVEAAVPLGHLTNICQGFVDGVEDGFRSVQK